MVSRRRTDPEPPQRRSRPATTPEGREKQLVSLAVDLAEKRLREGTATAAEVVHFLKLASSREQLEQQRLASENELLKVKVQNLASMQRQEELYKEALQAMSSYQGREVDETVYED